MTTETSAPTPQPSDRSWPQLVAVGVVIALVAGLVGGLLGANLRGTGETGTTTPGTSSVCTASQVATSVLPSLVEISVSAGKVGSLGSGSVIDAAGHVLTNNHVVEPGDTPGGTITVSLARGQTDVPATIVGRDPLTDVAVLKLGSGAGTLTPITIGSSANLVVGQPVVALGSPLGLTDTVTTGVVSALDRLINVGSVTKPSVLVGAVQTDAAINPGNSGGPLVDCDGKQVGINSAGASPAGATGGGGSVGLNFAIPIDFAMAEANQIISTGSVDHGSIGVIGVSVTAEIAKNTGLPRGVYVQAVAPRGPADSGGVKAGDVITQVNGTATPTLSDYLVQIVAIPVGGTASLTVQRGSQTQTISCRVADLSTLDWGL